MHILDSSFQLNMTISNLIHTFIFFPNILLKNFKPAIKLKELCSEYPSTYHLDPTINISLDLCYHMSVYSLRYPSSKSSFLMHFKFNGNCQHTSFLNISACLLLNRIQNLFGGLFFSHLR